jgi:hypothetical protein
MVLLSHLEGKLLFGFGKILYQPTPPKDLDSYFDKIETHVFEHTLVPESLTLENS